MYYRVFSSTSLLGNSSQSRTEHVFNRELFLGQLKCAVLVLSLSSPSPVRDSDGGGRDATPVEASEVGYTKPPRGAAAPASGQGADRKSVV